MKHLPFFALPVSLLSITMTTARCVIIFACSDKAAEFRELAKNDGLCIDGVSVVAFVVGQRDVVAKLIDKFKGAIKSFSFDQE